jgi:hypothetical protein
MIFIAHMNNGGVFEASSKRELVSQMIEHYGQQDEQADNIKAIYCLFKDESVEEFCDEIVKKVQKMVDVGVAEWRKNASEDSAHYEQLESEIRGAIYY